jgi:two-component system, cell cycle sensor histidine kinase and response regulator CckA
MVAFILILSLLLQLLAIYFALSLIRLTHRRLAWGLIAGAIALMALRRGISLVEILFVKEAVSGELIVELVALTISSLMVVGIARITPIFKELSTISDRLREAQEVAHLGSWELNLVTHDLWWSDETYRIFGMEPGTPNTYESFLKTVHPDDRAYLDREFKESIKNRTPYNIEHRLLMPDGSVKWLHNRGNTHYDGDGTPLRAYGTTMDITEHKQAEIRIHESEERYRTLITGMSEGVVLQDSEGVVLTCNPVAEHILGLAHKDMVGRTAADPRWGEIHEDGSAFPEEENPALVALRTGLPQTNIVMGLKRPDENLVWISINAQPLFRQGESKSYAVVVTFNDITERLHAEKEREDLQQQLQQTQKMESIGRLAGGVAHDFNNMLGVIIGSAELAQLQVSPEQKQLSKHLQEILNTAHRSADLTRQLLAFARKQTTIPKVLDLNESVESTQKMLKRMINEDVTLTWIRGEGIWPVMIDPSQLDQILANLCVNARDAIGGAGNISIETANASIDAEFCARHPNAMPGDYVRLSVSDDGSGIGKDAMMKIFEPFYTTKSLGEGTGLGLSTVYGIVEQNKGFIEVDSELGRGTVFNIYLPRHDGSSKQKPGEAKKVTPLVRGDEHILLVEDEAAILNVAKLALDRCGYTVLIARSPEEAMRIAKDHPGKIDMLITDIILPGMNGRELAKNLSPIYPRMRFLYMSGYSGEVISGQSIRDEGLNFIQKPFTIGDLAAKVREVLDS